MLTEYVYLEGTPLAMIANNQLSYIHPDPLGTPERLTDASGRVVWSATYDPFGRAAVQNDPDGNGQAVTLNLRFPGQYFDAETGLHYNYFRDYDPGTGRYIESDPIGLEGGLNTYLYANGNPISFVDPTGENPVVAAAIRAAISAALAGARAAIQRCAGNPVCKCRALYAGYKTLQPIGCKSNICAIVTAQAAAAGVHASLRSLYIKSGCDQAIPTGVSHPGALQQAIAAAQNCATKAANICGNCSGTGLP